jgi:hypothetical protein
MFRTASTPAPPPQSRPSALRSWALAWARTYPACTFCCAALVSATWASPSSRSPSPPAKPAAISLPARLPTPPAAPAAPLSTRRLLGVRRPVRGERPRYEAQTDLPCGRGREFPRIAGPYPDRNSARHSGGRPSLAPCIAPCSRQLRGALRPLSAQDRFLRSRSSGSDEMASQRLLVLKSHGGGINLN